MATLYMDNSSPLEDMSLEEMQDAFGNEADWIEQLGQTLKQRFHSILVIFSK